MPQYSIIFDEIGPDMDVHFLKKFLGIDSVVYTQSFYPVELLHKLCPKKWRYKNFPNRIYIVGNKHAHSLTSVKNFSKKIFENYTVYDKRIGRLIVVKSMKHAD